MRGNFGTNEFSPAGQHARDGHGLFPASGPDQRAHDTPERLGIAGAFTGAAVPAHDAGIPPLCAFATFLGGGSGHRGTELAHNLSRRESVEGRLAAFLGGHAHTSQQGRGGVHLVSVKFTETIDLAAGCFT